MFVDTNLFMYAVGRPHPLRTAANDFFAEADRNQTQLFTSVEVLQELLHVYVSSGRPNAFQLAMELIERADVGVWSLEPGDVALARELYERHPNLSARDLCHLASCVRRGVREIKTFDRAFQAAAGREFGAPR